MSFVFFGTNRFSAAVMEKLISAGFVPDALVTAPDAPAGRKKILTPSPAKLIARQHGIPVLQPESLKKDPDIADEISSHRPEFGVVAAYAKLIPQSMLDLFPRQVLNVHPSLLPLWRGASPIENAIMHGDAQTGVTIILLDRDMDHGPILAQEQTPIGPDEYFESLYGRLAMQGADLLIRTIPQWLQNKISPVAQHHDRATFSTKLSWVDGKIRHDMTIRDAYNRVRALSQEPGTWIDIALEAKPSVLKILRAKPLLQTADAGARLTDGISELNKKPCFACKDGYLELEIVQPQSGKAMPGVAFLNGYRAKLG